jgi:hypothetical protein
MGRASTRCSTLDARSAQPPRASQTRCQAPSNPDRKTKMKRLRGCLAPTPAPAAGTAAVFSDSDSGSDSDSDSGRLQRPRKWGLQRQNANVHAGRVHHKSGQQFCGAAVSAAHLDVVRCRGRLSLAPIPPYFCMGGWFCDLTSLRHREGGRHSEFRIPNSEFSSSPAFI